MKEFSRLEMFEELERRHDFLFGRFGYKSKEFKERLVKHIFNGKGKLTVNDINLLEMKLRNLVLLDSFHKYVDFIVTMEEYPDKYIPIYLDMYTFDGRSRKEYMEVNVIGEDGKDFNIEMKAIVIPMIPSSPTDIFHDILTILYETNKIKDKTLSQATFYNKVCNLFEPRFEYYPVDTPRLAIINNRPTEDFGVIVGRYNVLKEAIVIYFGEKIIAKTITSEDYIKCYEVNLEEKENYKQSLLNLLGTNPELFNSADVVRGRDKSPLDQNLTNITEHIKGGLR